MGIVYQAFPAEVTLLGLIRGVLSNLMHSHTKIEGTPDELWVLMVQKLSSDESAKLNLHRSLSPPKCFGKWLKRYPPRRRGGPLSTPMDLGVKKCRILT